jgi:hypothetical protein
MRGDRTINRKLRDPYSIFKKGLKLIPKEVRTKVA